MSTPGDHQGQGEDHAAVDERPGQSQHQIRQATSHHIRRPQRSCLHVVHRSPQPQHPLSGRQIQEKALLLSVEMGHDDFSASNGWLESWRRRYNVKWTCLSDVDDLPPVAWAAQQLHGASGRHILLFIDNCTANPDVQLSNVHIQFLPKNTTSKLQPCDAGVIQTLKKLHYMKRLLRHLLHKMDDCNSTADFAKKVTALDAIFWLHAAWIVFHAGVDGEAVL